MNPVRRWLGRQDSLFLRLLALQAGLAIGLSAIYFSFYFVERNRAVAMLTADRWADALRMAAGQTDGTQAHGPKVEVRDEAPPEALEVPRLAPRIDAFRQELAARGLQVHRMAWDNHHQPTRVWVQVDGPQQRLLWLGFDAPLMASHEVVRLLLALLGAGALVLTLAWWPSRRLTRRLERLQQHMRDGLPCEPSPPDLGAAPEVVDIERAYAALLQQIQRQHSERDLLLAGVSHDLRSPLSRIRMAVALLPDDPQTALRKRSIVANVQAADQLIESFMDLVRSAELPLDQTVDLAELTCQVVAMFDQPDGALVVEAPPSVLLHQAHPHLLARALFNLVDNALQHGQAPVQVRVIEQVDEVWLEVQDAGPGVPAAEREWVLQAFSRGDASRGKVGSGLGLAIVRQLVERLQGGLSFAGQAGAWTVRLRLPRRAARTAPASAP